MCVAVVALILPSCLLSLTLFMKERYTKKVDACKISVFLHFNSTVLCVVSLGKKKQKRIKIGYELWQNKRARRSDRFLWASFRRRRRVYIVVVLYLFALLFWLSFYCFSIQTFKWWIFLSLAVHTNEMHIHKKMYINSLLSACIIIFESETN